jgi:hypothetical protein
MGCGSSSDVSQFSPMVNARDTTPHFHIQLNNDHAINSSVAANNGSGKN